MLDFIGACFKKRRDLIVEKEDVMVVLEVIDEVNQESNFDILMNMDIGSCGWEDKPTKWFIMFDASNNKWRSILKRLYEVDRVIVLGEDDRFYVA